MGEPLEYTFASNARSEPRDFSDVFVSIQKQSALTKGLKWSKHGNKGACMLDCSAIILSFTKQPSILTSSKSDWNTWNTRIHSLLKADGRTAMLDKGCDFEDAFRILCPLLKVDIGWYRYRYELRCNYPFCNPFMEDRLSKCYQFCNLGDLLSRDMCCESCSPAHKESEFTARYWFSDTDHIWISSTDSFVSPLFDLKRVLSFGARSFAWMASIIRVPIPGTSRSASEAQKFHVRLIFCIESELFEFDNENKKSCMRSLSEQEVVHMIHNCEWLISLYTAVPSCN